MVATAYLLMIMWLYILYLIASTFKLESMISRMFFVASSSGTEATIAKLNFGCLSACLHTADYQSYGIRISLNNFDSYDTNF